MNETSSQRDSGVISPNLLAILVCPVDKKEVRVEGNELVCTACGRRYPIEAGIPNMLIDQSA